MVVNAGHPEGNDDLEKVLGRTIAEVFPTVMRDPIEPTNTLLVASEAPLSRRAIRRAPWAGCRSRSRNLAATEASRLGRGWQAARSTPTIARRSSG